MACSTESALRRTARYLWRWTPFSRNAPKPADKPFVAVWSCARDEVAIRKALAAEFPDIPEKQLPSAEEDIRHLLRTRLPVPEPSYQEVLELQNARDAERGLQKLESEREKQRREKAEESWQHVPDRIRFILAALNADQLEAKLHDISQKDYHTGRGAACAKRSLRGTSKIFGMWRNGFKAGVSLQERVLIQVFFWFLMFLNVFPNVAAGFLGERTYNTRQTGSRVYTLIQWCYLYSFDYPILWLLFNWSLERLFGALVGNAAYAFAALIPAVHRVYDVSWFKTMVLVLSVTWQVGVQFGFTVRDIIVRLITRREMSRRRRTHAEKMDWNEFDASMKRELTTLKTFRHQQSLPGAVDLTENEVPLKVRVERYIQFTNSIGLGRSMDMLIGLQKDDLENILNLFEDYAASGPKTSDSPGKKDKGYAEPRWPKWLMVIFDIAIFAYVCYSFWFQPFTFNTVVAYGAVVIIKQTIIALKRYQTVKSAQRLFTNMTAFNIWGIFLVSVPVTVNQNVLADNGTFAALMISMVFCTVFLIEPLAPLFQFAGEKATGGCIWVYGKLRRSSPKSTRPSTGTKKPKLDSGSIESVGEKVGYSSSQSDAETSSLDKKVAQEIVSPRKE